MKNKTTKYITFKPKHFFFISILFIALLFFMTMLTYPVFSASGGIAWNNYEKGTVMAKEQNKKIFLYFHADWCRYCREMDMSTFQDKSVIDYINSNFISIKVNSDIEGKLADDYKVRGLPVYWFLKSNGDRLSAMPGYIDAKRLLTILKYVHTESYEKMSYSDFEKTII